MVQLTRQSGDHRMKNNRKDIISPPEPESFFDKLEKGETTPKQASQAIIAKIMLKLNLGVGERARTADILLHREAL